jgi:NADH:ubiquinone oxidoreductase subunit 6 (subunit J)
MAFFFSMIIILPIFILINNNPIYGLLALILTFINFSFILFSIGLEFLALAYLIVYVGAICVLFIFVILLLNLRFFSYSKNTKSYLVMFCLFVLLTITFYLSNTNIETFKDYCNIIEHRSDLELFALSFFQEQYVYFLLAGYLLLLAIIACIYLTLHVVPSKKIKYYYE